MPKVPKVITVDAENHTMLIDGVEFPWHITKDGVTLNNVGTTAYLPSVTITLVTEAVEVTGNPSR